MSTIDEMWTELARYQLYADRRGFGPEWRRMCEERTDDAADAVYAACGGAANVAESAESAAGSSAYAAASAVQWSQIAIENIRDAISYEKESLP